MAGYTSYPDGKSMRPGQPSELIAYLHGLVRTETLLRPDQQLAEDFLTRRDEEAFTALVQRHGPMVYGVCRRLLHQREDAEDAFQAVFLVLARKLGTVRKRPSLGSWLHGVAFRIALKARRQGARHPRPDMRNANLPPTNPVDDLAWREVWSLLDAELQQLPEPCREALVLCFLEGKTQEEAARHLGMSKSTLLRRLTRGRELLGKRLLRRGVTLPAGLSAALGAEAAAAPLPAELLAAATRTALAFAGGEAAGLVSPTVAILTKGALRAMAINRLKGVLLIVLLAAVAAATSGAALHWAQATAQDQAPAATPATPLPANRQENKDRKAKDDSAEAVKVDLDSLQGTWKVIRMQVNGVNQPVEEIEKFSLTFRDDTLSWVGQYLPNPDSPHGQVVPTAEAIYTVRIDPTKKPKTIDLQHKKVESKRVQGVYQLHGEAADFGYTEAGARPQGFAAKPGDGACLMTLQREKKKDPKAGEGKAVKVLGTAEWPYVRANANDLPGAGMKQLVIRSEEELVRASGIPPGRAQKELDRFLATAFKGEKVDFNKHMLVAVSGGVQFSTGPSVKVTKVELDQAAKTLIVHWNLHTPAGAFIQVTTHPAVVLLLERFDGAVKFDPPATEPGPFKQPVGPDVPLNFVPPKPAPAPPVPSKPPSEASPARGG